MKKIALLCLVLLLALSACNLPADEQTPSQDAIATRVSIQLTSLPTATLQPTVEPSATPEATATLEPTATTTVTNTPEATATTATNDIRATLGEPTWKETFTSGKSFGLDNEGYDDDQTSIRIENEALVLVSKTASGYHGWRTGGPSSSTAPMLKPHLPLETATAATPMGWCCVPPTTSMATGSPSPAPAITGLAIGRTPVTSN